MQTLLKKSVRRFVVALSDGYRLVSGARRFRHYTYWHVLSRFFIADLRIVSCFPAKM